MPAQRVWFTHGPHAGMCVEDLVESSLKQEVRPEGLTPLVEVAWRKNLFVVFGNRRWWALKEFCNCNRRLVALMMYQACMALRERLCVIACLGALSGTLLAGEFAV